MTVLHPVQATRHTTYHIDSLHIHTTTLFVYSFACHIEIYTGMQYAETGHWYLVSHAGWGTGTVRVLAEVVVAAAAHGRARARRMLGDGMGITRRYAEVCKWTTTV